uniref:WD_REPEATS_REGION domain-containing protein n=1 Tax=Strongyloides venezuelensis TaxID=75913 RepID=A0A0K0EXG2_STRVS
MEPNKVTEMSSDGKLKSFDISNLLSSESKDIASLNNNEHLPEVSRRDTLSEEYDNIENNSNLLSGKIMLPLSDDKHSFKISDDNEEYYDIQT